MHPSNKLWTLAAIGLLALASACSGGGSRSTPVVPNANQPGQPQQSAGKNVALKFTIPAAKSPASLSRSLQFVSHNTTGIVATITQQSPSPTSSLLVDQEQFDVSGPPVCDASAPATRHCLLYISAKSGVDNVELDLYDTSPNTPGQIATPSATTAPCRFWAANVSGPGNPGNQCPIPKAPHGLGVAITGPVTIGGGANTVTMLVKPIVDSFAINGQPAESVIGAPQCLPESANDLTPSRIDQNIVNCNQGPGNMNNHPFNPSLRVAGHPLYTASIDGNTAAAFLSIPLNMNPGVLILDGSFATITGDGTCLTQDQFYNSISVEFQEFGSFGPSFTTAGQLFKILCGATGKSSVIGTDGNASDEMISPDDNYQDEYTGHGGVGIYYANGIVAYGSTMCTPPSYASDSYGPGYGPTTPTTDLAGPNACTPYHNEVTFIPQGIDTSAPQTLVFPTSPTFFTPGTGFLGPLPDICLGCEAPSPGNNPPNGLGVGYFWNNPSTSDNWRDFGFIMAPLYGVVVFDGRCPNSPNIAGFNFCGGAPFPANNDTGTNHTQTQTPGPGKPNVVLGGPYEIAVLVAAQWMAPTGFAGQYNFVLTGCPADLKVSAPGNAFNTLTSLPGYTDSNGDATWGGRIWVITAGTTLFGSNVAGGTSGGPNSGPPNFTPNGFYGCRIQFTDGSGTITQPIYISNPAINSVVPGTITI